MLSVPRWRERRKENVLLDGWISIFLQTRPPGFRAGGGVTRVRLEPDQHS